MIASSITMRRAAATLMIAAAFAAPVVLTGCGSETSDAGSAAEEQVEEVQSDFAVTIDGSTLTTDYEGNPAMIVDYTFTNNSEEATSFFAACDVKAFQNGVQLEIAAVMDDLGNGYMAEIKPGATTQARLAYALTDSSDVSVEVSELFSFDDVMLAEATFPAA